MSANKSTISLSLLLLLTTITKLLMLLLLNDLHASQVCFWLADAHETANASSSYCGFVDAIRVFVDFCEVEDMDVGDDDLGQ
ncbi:hypothetical protein QYF36_024003 [Acer negundo]|nr:hypothetical protein QYF36_024003 [Acer negundo]